MSTADATSGGGGEDVVFDSAVFSEACDKIFSRWQSQSAEESWGVNVDAIVILAGSTQDDVITFPKSLALHAALFQLELSDVILVFTENDIYLLAASKKAKIAQNLSDSLPSTFGHKLVVLTRDKTDKDAANFQTLIDKIKQSKKGKKVGTLTKEKNSGAFAEGWEKVLKASELDVVDVQNGISDFLSIKSAAQIKAVKQGAALSTEAFKKKVINKILDIVDEENDKFSMLTLTEQVESGISKLAKEQKLDENDVDVILPPIVQSGNGGYDLKYSAQSQDKSLSLPDQGVPAIHVASITLRYKLISCTVARSLLFNAKKDQVDNYKALATAFETCLNIIKPGVSLNKVYEEVTSSLKESKPELLSHLHKELGWGMGYEIREKRLVLDEKNKHKFHVGQVFCLRIGLENLECKNVKGATQKYSLLIADTIIVNETGAEVITTLGKKHSKVSWNVSDEQEEEKKTEKKKPTQEDVKKVINDKFGKDKTRKMTESEETDKTAEFERRNLELAKRRTEEQRRRFLKELGDDGSGKAMERVTGYNGPEDFPSRANGQQLCVDDSTNTVLVPVNGMAVPFHVSVVKNLAIQQHGNQGGTVLRINFLSPGFGINVANKTLMYLREISFRAQEPQNLQMVHKQINDMKKAFASAEKEKKARDELVPQEALRINPNRGPMLKSLKIYPNLQARGKKTEGTLEAHVNGFRFTMNKAPSPDLKHVDILYRNVKHAFFQQSNNSSTLILLHFRLKNPIMIGKQSTKDIQFFVEWMEDGESLIDNKRKNAYDRDELEDENRQKQMRFRLDSEFKRFCDKTQDLLPPEDPAQPDGEKIWEWDIPYSELEFQGNPKSSMVELYPTVNCIVHLATKPVCIIELDSVDMAYYERIRSGNKNFDLTFVYKQFLDADAKIADCWQRITAIDMKYYDNVKEVLQKSKLVQYEGTIQINWNNTLKDYIKNFEDITKDGGWAVIFGQDEDDDEEDDEEDEDDDFKADSSASGSSEEEESDDYSSGVPEDSDDYSDEELSDEGMDSEEGEAWAEEEDQRNKAERREKELQEAMKGKSKRKHDDRDDDRSAPKKKKGLGSKNR